MQHFIKLSVSPDCRRKRVKSAKSAPQFCLSLLLKVKSTSQKLPQIFKRCSKFASSSLSKILSKRIGFIFTFYFIFIFFFLKSYQNVRIFFFFSKSIVLKVTIDGHFYTTNLFQIDSITLQVKTRLISMQSTLEQGRRKQIERPT